jgi:hypothetical protein
MADIYGRGYHSDATKAWVFGVKWFTFESAFCYKHLHQGMKGTGQEYISIC